MAEDITREEWLAELNRLMHSAPTVAGMSIEEIRESLGLPPTSFQKEKVRLAIRQQIKAGLMEAAKRPGIRIDGSRYLQQVYRVKSHD